VVRTLFELANNTSRHYYCYFTEETEDDNGQVTCLKVKYINRNVGKRKINSGSQLFCKLFCNTQSSFRVSILVDKSNVYELAISHFIFLPHGSNATDSDHIKAKFPLTFQICEGLFSMIYFVQERQSIFSILHAHIQPTVLGGI
jgi:hypothetical protein